MAKVEIFGLEDIRKELAPSRISSILAKNTNNYVLTVHNVLKSTLRQNYNSKYASLDTVLVGRSDSDTKQGKNFIKAGLEYKFKPVRLITMLDSTYLGNTAPNRLNPRVPRKRGKVAVVKIGRIAKPTIGKLGFGGFRISKNNTGQLAERLTQSRFPYHILFAPSLASLVSYNLENPRVKKAIDKASERIIENLF